MKKTSGTGKPARPSATAPIRQDLKRTIAELNQQTALVVALLEHALRAGHEGDWTGFSEIYAGAVDAANIAHQHANELHSAVSARRRRIGGGAPDDEGTNE